MDYKARFYSPTLGRFTQPDSLVPEPSNPQAWNRYSYVGNNPIVFNDPTGHMVDSSGSYNPWKKTVRDKGILYDLERDTYTMKVPATSVGGGKVSITRPWNKEVEDEEPLPGNVAAPYSPGAPTPPSILRKRPVIPPEKAYVRLTPRLPLGTELLSVGGDIIQGVTGVDIFPNYIEGLLDAAPVVLDKNSDEVGTGVRVFTYVSEGVVISKGVVSSTAVGCLVGGGPESPGCYLVGPVFGIYTAWAMSSTADSANEKLLFPFIRKIRE